MFWLLAVLVAAVSNLDNLGVGFAFGLRDTRIAIAPNLVIAALTMAGTAGAMTFGRELSHLVSLSIATDTGSLVMIGIGTATVVASLRVPVRTSATDRPTLAAMRGASKTVPCRAAVPIGVALSLNNIGSGVGAGIAGIPPLATTVLAGAFSLICVGAGARVGWTAARAVATRHAGLAAGVVLVGVGAATALGA